tara:strand:+ start:639 stop:950 length:312 start_codon:yes stop_codon:yes gene_type:complete
MTPPLSRQNHSAAIAADLKSDGFAEDIPGSLRQLESTIEEIVKYVCDNFVVVMNDNSVVTFTIQFACHSNESFYLSQDNGTYQSKVEGKVGQLGLHCICRRYL